MESTSAEDKEAFKSATFSIKTVVKLQFNCPYDTQNWIPREFIRWCSENRIYGSSLTTSEKGIDICFSAEDIEKVRQWFHEHGIAEISV